MFVKAMFKGMSELSKANWRRNDRKGKKNTPRCEQDVLDNIRHKMTPVYILMEEGIEELKQPKPMDFFHSDMLNSSGKPSNVKVFCTQVRPEVEKELVALTGSQQNRPRVLTTPIISLREKRELVAV